MHHTVFLHTPVGRTALPPSCSHPPPTKATESADFNAYRWLSPIRGTTVGRTDEHHTRLWCARAPKFRATRVIRHRTTATTAASSTIIKLIASYHGRLLFVIIFVYGTSLRRSKIRFSDARDILYYTPLAMCNIFPPFKIPCRQDGWKNSSIPRAKLVFIETLRVNMSAVFLSYKMAYIYTRFTPLILELINC